MNADQLKKLENDLWSAADTLRANSGLKSSEYATPILGLIFLKFADNKYRKFEAEIQAEHKRSLGTRAVREIPEIAVEKCGFYLPDAARYDALLNMPESEDIALAIQQAMEAIEKHVGSLKDALPKNEYFRLAGKDNAILKRLLANFSNIPPDAEGDLFGQIYEYFLGKFALAEGAGGGEFFTPRSVVRLMVEIIEPHRGRVFDPACGSGGMFVQSVRFIEERRKHGGADTADDLYVCGQEKTGETVKLARMNLAVNGLRGEIKEGNSYSQDLFDSFGSFDYVMANPPFNVDNADVETVAHDPRFNTYGIPRNKSKASGKSKTGADKNAETVPNGNYLWISLFATSLKHGGRAALVMANSASDAQHTEADIRKRLIEADLIYGMLALPSNMFYTVTLPATLWFFEKGKTDDRLLFIDARNVFTQIDRAHREFTEDQVQNLAVISHLHRGERHRFLERVATCMAEGRQRAEACRAEYPCVQKLLTEALPEPALDGLDAESDSVTDARAILGEAMDHVKILWHDEDGEPSGSPLGPQVWGNHAGAPLDPPSSPQPWGNVQFSAHLSPSIGGRGVNTIEETNRAQQALVTTFSRYLNQHLSAAQTLDRCLRDYEKAVAERAEAAGKRKPQDRKLRDAKAACEAYTANLKSAIEPFKSVRWLHERFPDAEYADVTGLCKLATKQEVAAQDYSLNPGRYVGVVIEEDGKTEEEFRADLLAMNTELETFNAEAAQLAQVISQNVRQMAGLE